MPYCSLSIKISILKGQFPCVLSRGDFLWSLCTWLGDRWEMSQIFGKGTKNGEGIVMEWGIQSDEDTLSSQPMSLTPQPWSLSPRPWSLTPQPSSLCPRPSSLSPHPSSLSPQPCVTAALGAACAGWAWGACRVKSAADAGGQYAFKNLPSCTSSHARSLVSEGVSVISSF